jgi:PDZ domain
MDAAAASFLTACPRGCRLLILDPRRTSIIGWGFARMAGSGDGDLFAAGLRPGPARRPSALEISENAIWVSGASDGDRAPFNQLLEQCARTVRGVLLAKVPIGDVDGLVQDFFIRALRGLWWCVISTTIQTLGISLLSMLAVAQTPRQLPPSFEFSSDASSRCIPAEVVADGLVLMQGGVNGHEGWFILDNASQGFTVDAEYARQNSLEIAERAPARGGGAGPIDAGVVRDVRISLDGLNLTHRNLVVIPLKAIEPAIGHAVNGIIGSRLFDDLTVVVDYERPCVSIYKPDRYHPTGTATVFPVRIDPHGFPFLEAGVVLPGMPAVRGNFLIDGGANTFADLYKVFSDAHGIPPRGMKLLDEPGTSTGGRTQSRDGRADRIDLGPYSIRNPPITFAQDTEGLMAAKDYAGLIGAEFLRRFTVVFDNSHKHMLLTPNRRYPAVAAYDQSGLRIRAEPPDFRRFVVTRIVPGSAAAVAGIMPGDVITSIAGRAAQDLTLTELRELLRAPNGRYTLGITRRDRQFRLKIRLRAII